MSWRTEILQDFVPQVARLTIVVDADNLFNEENILQSLHEQGFGVLRYEEPISFRFAYESQYRLNWDAGQNSELIVLVESEAKFAALPYDLQRQGRELRYSLGDFFPEFSYAVIRQLEPSDLDKLYSARQQIRLAGNLGQKATSEFLLKNVFQINPEQINTTAELLRMLLQRHYTERKLPDELDKYLIETLGRKAAFKNWPLAQILPDREAFLTFLQGQWPNFLERWLTERQVELDEDSQLRLAETKATYQTTPLDLPFGDEDVRIYIDNYFVERLIQPVEFATLPNLSSVPSGTPSWWINLGMKENREARLHNLIQNLARNLLDATASGRDWLEFAPRWAELNVLRQQVETPPSFADLQAHLDDNFTQWAMRKYGSLPTLTAREPIMLHRVPEYLNRFVKESKIALVVLDGLSLDQWFVLRNSLPHGYHYKQSATFAWLPTLTSVSRQALFSGKRPYEFESSLDTTNKEEQLWLNFWQSNANLNQSQVIYRRNVHRLEDLTAEFDAKPRAKVVGLVVNTVDDLMHGSVLGMAGMYSQLRQWGQSGKLTEILDWLLSNQFRIWLTSDHGNIEATGIGKPSEGSLADKQGERVRVYNDSALLLRAKQNIPEAVQWHGNGLPEKYQVLFAPKRTAFIPKNEKIIAHGGLTAEEVIVPLVEISEEK